MNTAVVTGASRGIGAAIAKALARDGYAVAVNYRQDQKGALATVEEIRDAGGTAGVFQADVSDEGQVAALFDKVNRELGSVQVLVCNAGQALQKLVTDISGEEWDRLFAVNVKGVFACCKAVLPHMIRRQSGRIITVSSIWGVTGASMEAAYSASKAAVIGFTKALAQEVGPSGITVNCIAPGLVYTKIMDRYSERDIRGFERKIPAGRGGTVDDIVPMIQFLADKKKSSFIVGQTIFIDGGQSIDGVIDCMLEDEI